MLTRPTQPMNHDLMRYSKGQSVVRREERPVAAQAKQIYDDTRIAAFKVDASMALANHIMQGVIALDQRRRDLAQDDPALNMLLAEIEATAMIQIKGIQRDLFNNWGF